MHKKVVRHFSFFIQAQETWLNRMAAKGHRLVNTKMLSYEFELCQPNEYAYRVDFVAHKSYREIQDYRAFLEELGYRVFYKSINLNYSFGKVKWRPAATPQGQFATSPGGYNKELLIVEKKNDGKPFALHTDLEDIKTYYKTLRRFCILPYLILFPILFFSAKMPWKLIAASATALLLLFVILLTYRIYKISEAQKITE